MHIHNIEKGANRKNESFKLSVQDICCCKKNIYILDRNNGLFTYDSLNQQFTFLGEVEGNENARYMKMHVFEHSSLLFVPYNYGNIIQYRIRENDFQIFCIIDFENHIDCMPWKKMFQYENTLYFLGLDSKVGIISIDLPTRKARIESDWKEAYRKEFGNEVSLYFNIDACQVENSFWVPLNKNNMIMEYNMQNKKCFFYKVGKEEIQYATICYDGKGFWLSGDAIIIVNWDLDTNEAVEYRKFPPMFKKRNFKYELWNSWDSLFLNSLKLCEYLFLSPLRSNMIIAVDLEKKEIVEVKRIDDDISFFPLQVIDEEHMYYQEQGIHSECICEYRISSYHKIENGIFKEFKIGYRENAFLCNRKIIEIYPSMLKDYIYCVKQCNDRDSIREKDNSHKWRKWIKNKMEDVKCAGDKITK